MIRGRNKEIRESGLDLGDMNGVGEGDVDEGGKHDAVQGKVSYRYVHVLIMNHILL